MFLQSLCKCFVKCVSCCEKLDNCKRKKTNESTPVINKYKQLKDNLRPLDMIAFRGAGLISDVISQSQQVAQGSGKWTHVGLIVNTSIMPDILNSSKDKWYVWESTSLAQSADAETGEMLKGVQIRDLSVVIKEYAKYVDTEVCVFRLKDNPYIIRENELNESYQSRLELLRRKMTKLHGEYLGRPFDFTGSFPALCKCLRKYRDVFILNQIHDYAMFNSELVASIYKRIGLLPDNINVENVVPMDFFGFDKDREIPLLFEMEPITLLQTGRYVIS